MHGCNAAPPTATDNCAGLITGTSNISLPITTQGTTIVTWTYNDGSGNISTQNQRVIIEDITPPTITYTEQFGVYLSPGETSYTVRGAEFDPTGVADNCGVATLRNDFNNLQTLAGVVLLPGTYSVNWTATDINGKSETVTSVIIIYDDLRFPNVVTPNGDGINDTWEILGVERLQGYTVSIFDRQGKVVLKTNSYDNSWNGTFNGQPLPNGTYYYVITNGKSTYKGYISVLR